MKIAVFCASESSTAYTKLQSIFFEKDIFSVVYADAVLLETNKVNATELHDCTHCFFLRDNASQISYIAAVCFAVGRGITVTQISDADMESEKFKIFLNSEMKTFDRKKEIEDARSEIIQKGIPVLPDAFSDAVLTENIDLVELFFKAGFSPNTKNSKGVPLLCQVVRNRCWSMAYRLIDAGADVNLISDDRGYSALMDAVAIRQPELVKNLLVHRADPNVYSKDGQTALILAVANHDASIARVLLKHGADPDRTDKLGMSARGYATLFNKPELIQLFKNV